jgi:hypothetical protein
LERWYKRCKGGEIQENCEIKYSPSTSLSIGPPTPLKGG